MPHFATGTPGDAGPEVVNHMQLAPNRERSGVRSATVVNNVVDGQANPVVVDIEATSRFSVAMVENFVPLVARISLTNTSDAALSNLTVELALLPDFSAKWTAHVAEHLSAVVALLVKHGRAQREGDKVVLA